MKQDQSSVALDFEERRRFARTRTNCAMSFKPVASGTQALAQCIDISGSGIMFEGEEPIPIGRALEIRTFPSDRITPPITALIEVIRCVEAELGRFRITGVIKGIKSL